MSLVLYVVFHWGVSLAHCDQFMSKGRKVKERGFTLAICFLNDAPDLLHPPFGLADCELLCCFPPDLLLAESLSQSHFH